MGIGGGLLGGGGQELGAFENISEETTYIEGLDKFQENIGLLLNSYKDKYYTISADTSGTGDRTKRTRVNISTHVDLIPFWPTGVGQDYKVTVELAEMGDAQRVIIEEVQVQIWRTLDNDEIHFTESRNLWSIKPGTELNSEGQKKTFTTSISLEEMEDVIGLLTYVNIKFINKLGNEVDPNLVTNLAEPDPDKYEIPLALTVNLRVLDSGESTKLVMLIVSYPLSLVSLILTVLGFVMFFVSHFRPKLFRKAGYIILAAAILQILAAGFLYLGVENLIKVIDGVFKADLREGFAWTGALTLIFVPGVLLLPAAIITLVTHKKPEKEPKKPKGKKSEKEETEEKEDTFQLIPD
jgi:hypothetical protein